MDSASSPDDVISWENFIYCIDLLDADNQKHVSLLGGEPSLHPHFSDFIQYLHKRHFHTSIFTSGILSVKSFDALRKVMNGIQPRDVSFVVNINNPEIMSFPECESVTRFCKAFSPFTTLGYNIYRENFTFEFIVEYISKYGLHRTIRLGLAHPIPGAANEYIKPDNLHHMADRLISYLPLLNRHNISIGLDCGFPLCLFSDDSLGKLYKNGRGKASFNCGPAFDIGPDMSLWSCFPLSQFHRKSIFDFNSHKEIIDYYNDIHHKVRIEHGGLFPACDTCKYREMELCRGGCLAHSINSFQLEKKIRGVEFYP
jgi:radical SAM protein with 4Fe4S-binding SPASM domain